MINNVELADVLIFRYMPGDALQELSKHCQVRSLKPGENLVLYGAQMPGLFLVLEGSIEVCTDNFGEIITNLGIGASVGEMSLLDTEPRASASLRAGSQGAKLLSCPRQVIQNTIFSDENRAHYFYKGLSSLLSQRLRNTNRVFGKKIDEIKNSIREILDGKLVLKRITDLRVSLDDLGVGIVSSLVDSLAELDKFADDHADLDTTALRKLKLVVERVIIEDCQNFDRVSQKLNLIWQYLGNVRRTLCKEDLVEVQGDEYLFKQTEP